MKSHRAIIFISIALLLIGIALRVYPSAAFQAVGFDEGLYRNYVNEISRVGIVNYPDLAERYIERQQQLPSAILPPTRFLYIFIGYIWHTLTGAEPLTALHHTSTLFSCLLLMLAGVFAARLGGTQAGVAVLALMACAPTQIHMAQHALIDGFFAFWATLCLWLLWENLRRPNDWRFLMPYCAALALMVLTKENAAFAYLGLLALLALNRWLRFGEMASKLLLLTIAGPLIGVAVLVWLCGGVSTFVETYRLLVSKASVLPYAIATGDGPWYRYLLDLLLISPLIFLIAIGGLFRLRNDDKASVYLVVFVATTYLAMCNVRYGMNLRYTNMWDMPLRYLAVGCLTALTPLRYFAVAVVLLCAFDLHQYYVFFVQHNLYELVPAGLLHALDILK